MYTIQKIGVGYVFNVFSKSVFYQKYSDILLQFTK